MYSTGGLNNKNITNAPLINHSNLPVFSDVSSASALMISSMTYLRIKGINKGIANFKIPINTVPTIFHLYGITYLKYCFILLISPLPLKFPYSNHAHIPLFILTDMYSSQRSDPIRLK